jgi:hypothetical protein
VERTNTVMFQAIRSKGYRVGDEFNPFENELILHDDDPAFTTGVGLGFLIWSKWQKRHKTPPETAQ